MTLLQIPLKAFLAFLLLLGALTVWQFVDVRMNGPRAIGVRINGRVLSCERGDYYAECGARGK